MSLQFDAEEARRWLDSLDEVCDDPARQQFLYGSTGAWEAERHDAFTAFITLHALSSSTPTEIAHARALLQRHAEKQDVARRAQAAPHFRVERAKAPATGKHPDPAVQHRIESEAEWLRREIDALVSGAYAVTREQMATQIVLAAQRLASVATAGRAANHA